MCGETVVRDWIGTGEGLGGGGRRGTGRAVDGGSQRRRPNSSDGERGRGKGKKMGVI